MELTITQNGALFSVLHRPPKRNYPLRRPPQVLSSATEIPSLRTSVGELAFRPAQSGCRLEIIVRKVRRVLGVYETNEAAIDALKNRRTGFRTWDALDPKTAAVQTGALNDASAIAT